MRIFLRVLMVELKLGLAASAQQQADQTRGGQENKKARTLALLPNTAAHDRITEMPLTI